MYAETFVHLAETQAGDRYIYGAKESSNDPDPKSHGGAFDCSGLVSWAVRRAGGTIPDGSQAQLDFCRQHGSLISVAQAERTRGALLFLGPDGNEHVVISRGDGTTIEARGAAWGVGNWNVYRDAWTGAALVPGAIYGPGPSVPVPSGGVFVTHLQAAIGLQPAQQDGRWGDTTEGALRVHRGKTNDPVVGAVQNVFRTLVHGLVVDDDWGPNTESAYQKAHALYYKRY